MITTSIHPYIQIYHNTEHLKYNIFTKLNLMKNLHAMMNYQTPKIYQALDFLSIISNDLPRRVGLVVSVSVSYTVGHEFYKLPPYMARNVLG